MRVSNLDTIIVDFDDEPIISPTGKPLTLRAAIIAGLMYEAPQEHGKLPITGEHRFNLWVIANKVKLADESVELTAEEVSTIKAKVGEAFRMVVVGPVWSHLEKGGASE